MRILLIEDDDVVADALIKALTEQHYAVDVASDGQAGWELVEAFEYDLILLDLVLPSLDGISLCRRMRSHGLGTPVIMLTAKDTSGHKVMGLDAGADDYLTKPFDIAELLARMRALLRRGGLPLPPLLTWNQLQLNPSTCEVTYSQQTLHLTPKEYALLELFLRNPQRVFSSSAILDHLWSFEQPPREETVRAHIKGLRHKLKAAGMADDPIDTVYGMGYRLQALASDGGVNISHILPVAAAVQASPLQPPPPSSDSKPKWKTLAGVTGVWEKVKQRLDYRISVLEQAAQALSCSALGPDLWQQAESEAHKLAGSLGMFDMARGSRLALEVEGLLHEPTPLDAARQQRLHDLVVALRQELDQAQHDDAPPALTSNPNGQPLLLVVEPDQEFAVAVVGEVELRGWRGITAPTLDAAQELVGGDRPDVIVLNLGLVSSEHGYKTNGFTFLRAVSAQPQPIPTVAIAPPDNMADRVQVARLGGRGFLQQPIAPAQVVDMVLHLLQQSHPTTARVLVVDDDPNMLSALHTLLTPWDIRLTVLSDPLQFWDTLQATQPDLLVLDVKMPQVTGIELCQVVRNDWRWSNLPILFLTAHTDAETMHRVFAAGADDYVCKPIVGPELVTRILNRLERSRLRQHLAELDALTGVANRPKSTQALTNLLDLAIQAHQPFCLAVLRLQHLHEMNRCCGHTTTDQVLAQVGQWLGQRLTDNEIVGRWGGGEFVVGIYGMTAQDGVRYLSAVLEPLVQQIAAMGDRQLAVFTVGFASYPQDGQNLSELYEVAQGGVEELTQRDTAALATEMMHM